MKLEDVVEGIEISDSSSGKPQDCNVCIEGIMTQSRNRNPDARATAPLQLVHTDLAGPIDPVSREGFRYSRAFTDDYSGAVFVYFLKSKSDTVAATFFFWQTQLHTVWSNVLDQIMVMNLFLRSLSLCWRKIR